MEYWEKVNQIGDEILHTLIECYYSETNFYLKERIGHFLKEEEDMLIDNETIINNIHKKLRGPYYLQVDKVQRVFPAQKEDEEDIVFEDIKLEIKKREDND